MTITVDATVENGQFKPTQPIALAEGTFVRLTITPKQEADESNDPLAGLIGICTGGPRDGAQNHDQYIYGAKPE